MIDFKTLQVWEKAHALTLHVYRATEEFPNDEKFRLVSQMRRSCASIPTNLAEGCGRDSDKELIRFCNISMGSACELEYQLILARDLAIIDSELFTSLNTKLIEVKKMLLVFIRGVKKRL